MDMLPAAPDQLLEVDWAALSHAERVKWLELEGFVMLPNLLTPEQLCAIKAELARLPLAATDYSDKQLGAQNVQWTDSPQVIDTIAHPEVISFLERLFGDELIFTSCVYALSRPGHPGIAIHTDAQPYGSSIFGKQASSPRLVRVLYYLDDLTLEKAPLLVIPRSHLSMHADGNPYSRYIGHPDAKAVTCRAGSAAIINQTVFHANFPNVSAEDRGLLAIAYRPAWAGPIEDIEDWDPERVARLPEHVKPLFKSRNTRHIDYNVPNRPAGMRRDAPGISPGRWGY
ncbi:MAG: phytanoyl-CoA dioxygenase family protein [Paenibacillaceae bacterium]|nr:phytanoyl-CoA dioxygenase family protein [Paenibacillaceae bacterium]